jgi:hypothetical protein
MLKRLVVIALVGVFALPAVSEAQFTFGDRTFTIGAGIGTSDDNFDNNNLNFQASLGYFWMDNMEFVFRQGLEYDVNDDFRGISRVALDYYLPAGTFNPYVGASVGAQYGGGVTETLFAGPEVGMKYFLNETTFFAPVIEYHWGLDSDDDFDDRFVYTFGLGLKF